MAPEEVTPVILSKLEAKQISEEIAMCIGAGLSSWQILKTLRFMRQAAEDRIGFVIERSAPSDKTNGS